MKLNSIVEHLGLEVRAGDASLDVEIKGGYVSDLLSDVLANASEGDVWITLQIHPNIAAVASMKCVAAIIIINSREPAEETLKKADEENIPILVTSLPAFELVGRLYRLGVPGIRESVDGA